MKTPTTPITMDTPHGPLYIAVIPAKRHSHHEDGRGPITKMLPHLRVASDPAFTADPNAVEHWTIRGRAYGVHYEVFFEDRTHIEYADGRQGERWHRSSTPYMGGFRNGKCRTVPHNTPTFGQMWEAVTAALDAFAEAHPGWEDLSQYLLLWADADSAHNAARDLYAEAATLSAKAAVLEGEAGAIADTLPDALMALVPDALMALDHPDEEN